MFGWISARSGEGRPTLKNGADVAHGTGGGESGLISGTRVATAMGWRPVEAIAEGDKVLTFDAGLQTVTRVTRLRLWEEETTCPREFWPLEVPAGALGNREVMHLLPSQTVMVESDTAEDLYGDPFSLIPARAMHGVRGIGRVPPNAEAEVILLHFAEEQIVFANNGALFHCPSSRDILTCAYETAGEPFYSILPMDEARFLAVQLNEEPAASSTTAPQEFWAAAAPA